MTRLAMMLIMLCAATAVSAQKTTRPGLKAKTETKVKASNRVVADTVYDCDGLLLARGYDKAQSSNTESLFISNLTDTPVKAVNMTLTYYDMQGHQLHTRTETISSKLPAGQTVNVNLRAWDRQHLWHYHLTTASGRQGSTPFEVKIHINYIVTDNKRR